MAYIVGSEGNDAKYGTDYADEILGYWGDDWLFGYGGNDYIFGGWGDDWIGGGSGDDHLYGEYGNDHLSGDSGNDTLDGGWGSDVLFGGSGNDVLIGSMYGWVWSDSTVSGADYLYGGPGDDLYSVDGGDTVIESANDGHDGVLSMGDYVLPANVEDLALGSWASFGGGNELDNMIAGNNNNNYLWGEAGNDTLYGDNGSDVLFGGYGNDTLDGGLMNDFLYGNDGDDLLDGGKGDDYMNGGVGNDKYVVDSAGDVVAEDPFGGIDTVITTVNGYQLTANVENLVLRADAGNASGFGNELDNTIAGNAGGNILFGDDGGDHISGGDGFDWLFGNDGGDVLDGGAGNDVLIGGAGVDILIGGVDADTFVFESAAETTMWGWNDVITDFSSAAHDHIDLKGIDANTATNSDDAFNYIDGNAFTGKAGELRFAGGSLQGDINGDASADFTITVLTTSLHATDFIL